MSRPYVSIPFFLGLFLYIFFFVNEIPKIAKALLLLSGGAIFSIASHYVIFQYIGLEHLTFESFQTWLNEWNEQFTDSGGYVPINSYPLAYQWFTYLFRPLFFDARTIFGVIASVENLIWLLLTCSLFSRTFVEMLKKKENKFLYFILIMIFLELMILPIGSSNFGLILRQKTMILPFLLVLILAHFNYRKEIALTSA